MTSGSGVPDSGKIVGIDASVPQDLSQRANLQRGVAVNRHSGPSIRLSQHMVATADANDGVALPL